MLLRYAGGKIGVEQMTKNIVEFRGEQCRVEFAEYDNGRIAIRLVIDGAGEPIATASSNLVDEEWKVKNSRRVGLIKRNTVGALSSEEKDELNDLQAQLERHLARWDDRLLREIASLEDSVKRERGDIVRGQMAVILFAGIGYFVRVVGVLLEES